MATGTGGVSDHGGGILLSALMVVSVRNIVHAALFLALCFAGVAGIYVLLRAEFLAVAQVLIYIGAISVLFLFGIMLTRHITGQNIPQLVGIGSGRWVAAVLRSFAPAPPDPPHRVARGGRSRDSTTALGLALVERYVLPFELASVILLAAVVGAVVLAKQEGGNVVPLSWYLILAALLFCIGVLGCWPGATPSPSSDEHRVDAQRREYQPGGLCALYRGDADRPGFAIFVMMIAAAEAAVGRRSSSRSIAICAISRWMTCGCSEVAGDGGSVMERRGIGAMKEMGRTRASHVLCARFRDRW